MENEILCHQTFPSLKYSWVTELCTFLENCITSFYKIPKISRGWSFWNKNISKNICNETKLCQSHHRSIYLSICPSILHSVNIRSSVCLSTSQSFSILSFYWITSVFQHSRFLVSWAVWLVLSYTLVIREPIGVSYNITIESPHL